MQDIIQPSNVAYHLAFVQMAYLNEYFRYQNKTNSEYTTFCNF